MKRKIKLFLNKIFHKNSTLNFRRKRRKFNFERFKYLVILILELSFAIGCGYLVVNSFGRQIECANISMEPTYESGDILLVNTVAYKIHNPESGDIIAFKPKSNVNASYSVKRIVAVPGDTVVITNGRLYVNGEIFKSTVDIDTIEVAGVAASELTLGEDQYFVIGDNINSSEDSRYESIGMVSINDILGKVWIKYPF